MTSLAIAVLAVAKLKLRCGLRRVRCQSLLGLDVALNASVLELQMGASELKRRGVVVERQAFFPVDDAVTFFAGFLGEVFGELADVNVFVTGLAKAVIGMAKFEFRGSFGWVGR